MVHDGDVPPAGDDVVVVQAAEEVADAQHLVLLHGIRELLHRLDEVVDLVHAGIEAVPGAAHDGEIRADCALDHKGGRIGGSGARTDQVPADDVEQGPAVERRLVLGDVVYTRHQHLRVILRQVVAGDGVMGILVQIFVTGDQRKGGRCIQDNLFHLVQNLRLIPKEKERGWGIHMQSRPILVAFKEVFTSGSRKRNGLISKTLSPWT